MTVDHGFRSLAPMTIFSGTRDLLYPDSVALAEQAMRLASQSNCICCVTSRYALMPKADGRVGSSCAPLPGKDLIAGLRLLVDKK